MAAGVDGSIKMDTSISTAGFNDGVKRVTAFSGGVLRGVVKQVGKAAQKIFFRLHSLIRAIAATSIVVIALLAARLFQMLNDSISKTSAYYSTVKKLDDAFQGLKGAFLAAFATLLTAALPYILIVINWLTRMLNMVSMIIAAFTGQKTVIQYDAAATEKLAKSTEKTKKAAQGALAAFDQINVLAKAAAEQQAAADTGGPLVFKEVPVEQSAIAAVEKIQSWFANLWQTVKDGAIAAWNAITSGIGAVWETVKTVFGPVVKWLYDNLIKPVGDKIAELVQTFYQEVLVPFAGFFMGTIWPTLQTVFGLIIEAVQNLLVPVFQNGFETIKSIVKNVIIAVSDYFQGLLTMWKGVIEFLTGVFTGDWKLAWQGLVDIFSGIIQALGGIFRGVMNTIIDYINGVLRMYTLAVNNIVSGLNSIQFTIPDWVPVFGGQQWALNIPQIATPPQIPRLATGAVIPPNAQFAAILGDQRSGRNLEAPENLIRQILREELDGMRLTGDFNFNFEGTMGQLVRTLKPHLDSENIRIGTTLVKGAQG